MGRAAGGVSGYDPMGRSLASRDTFISRVPK